MRIHGYSIIAAGLVFGTTVIAPPALATTDEQVATRVTTQAQRLGVTDRTVLRIISDVASNASAILRSNPTGNLNSATGEILGVRTSITTPITFNRIAGERDVTASMNGNSVRIVTSARSYETTTTRDTLTVYVNGQQVYSGQVRNITQADLLRTYNAIGATESREITQRETARTSADVTFRVITQRVASFLAPVTPVQRARLKERQASASPSGVTAFEDKGFVGLSGGDDVLKWGAWGNIAHSWLENSGSLSAYNGGLTTGLVGADYLIHDMLLAGVALSYESLGLTTKFNSGRLDTTGIAVSPYAGVRFLDGRIVLDALYSHAWLDSSSSRNRDVAEITGSYTGSRDAAAVNLTYNHVINDFTLSPGIGLAYANERQGSFADFLRQHPGFHQHLYRRPQARGTAGLQPERTDRVVYCALLPLRSGADVRQQRPKLSDSAGRLLQRPRRSVQQLRHQLLLRQSDHRHARSGQHFPARRYFQHQSDRHHPGQVLIPPGLILATPETIGIMPGSGASRSGLHFGLQR